MMLLTAGFMGVFVYAILAWMMKFELVVEGKEFYRKFLFRNG